MLNHCDLGHEDGDVDVLPLKGVEERRERVRAVREARGVRGEQDHAPLCQHQEEEHHLPPAPNLSYMKR